MMRAASRIEHPSYGHKRKPNERVSMKHRDFVRTLPCAVSYRGGCAGPIEFAHVREGTDGGQGLKPSDRHGVPLCHQHHIHDQHVRGESRFWGNTEIAVTLAEGLYRHSGDRARGLRAIERAETELRRHG